MERSMLSLLITLKRLEALDKRRERIEKHPWMRIMYLLRDLVPVIAAANNGKGEEETG